MVFRRSGGGECSLDGVEVLTSVERSVHQALSMLPHNLRDDIGFERPCQGIDLCSRRQTILNGGLGRDDGPLLQRRVIDELQKSIVEAKLCTTPRACRQYRPGV